MAKLESKAAVAGFTRADLRKATTARESCAGRRCSMHKSQNMTFKANCRMRGSKVLVICPPPVGTPPVIAESGGVAPVPRVVFAVVVPWRAADVAGQIEVGVVEDVVGLGTELDFQSLDRSVERLVQIEVGFVERRRAARIARGIAKRAEIVS